MTKHTWWMNPENMLSKIHACAQSCVTVIPWTVEPARLLCPQDFKARILERVAIFSSRGSSNTGIQPMSPTFPALAGGFFIH